MSTHGYSQNQILVWKYPSLTQVAKLTGHSYRVLYLVSLRSWEGGVQIRPWAPHQGLGVIRASSRSTGRTGSALKLW